jgi:hypothetical protein
MPSQLLVKLRIGERCRATIQSIFCHAVKCLSIAFGQKIEKILFFTEAKIWLCFNLAEKAGKYKTPPCG